MKDYRIKMLDRTTLKRKKTPQPQEDIFPFLKLPQELRDKIYDLMLNYDGVQQCITSVPFAQSKEFCEIPARRRDFGFHLLKCMRSSWRLHRDKVTPTVLLICTFITSEALLRLHKKPLVLSTPPQFCHYHNSNLRTIKIMRAFITKKTLRSITRIHFELPVAACPYLCPRLGKSPAREGLLPWLVMILAICQVLKKSPVIQELQFQLKHREEDTIDIMDIVVSRGGKYVPGGHSSVQKFIEHLPAEAVTRTQGGPSLVPSLAKLWKALLEWSDYTTPDPLEGKLKPMKS